MTNPAKIHFVSPTVKPGDTVHVNSTGCHAGAPWREYTQPIIVIPATEHSDYSGSSVERSNERVLLATAAAKSCLIQLIGSHGYSGLAYQAYLGPVPPDDDLADSVAILDSGTFCLDDYDCSGVEQELESAAWEDHGRKDFRKALAPVLDAMDADHEHDLDAQIDDIHGLVTDEDIDRLWCDGCDVLNVNGGSGHVIETGCLVHFYIDKWCERAISDHWVKNPQRMQAARIADIVHKLRNLCMRTRVA